MTTDDGSSNPNLVLVLGYIAIKYLATTKMKVAVLSRLGYSNTDMSKICCTTSKVIKTLKSKIKKGGGKK